MLRFKFLVVAICLPLAALASDEEDSQAALSRGREYRSKNEIDKAIREFTEAIRLNSKNSAAFNERGSMRLRKKLFGEAVADYAEAIRVNPENSVAHNNSARLRATCPGCAISRRQEGRRRSDEGERTAQLGPMVVHRRPWPPPTRKQGTFSNAIKWQEKTIALGS